MRKPTTWTALKVAICVAASVLIGTCCTHTHHVDPDASLNKVSVCAGEAMAESTCGACASYPGCGWCDAPVGDAAQCQPASAVYHQSTRCTSKLMFNTTQCPAPPP